MLLGEWATNPSTAARDHSTWITNDLRALYTTNEAANEITALDTQSGAQQWATAVGDRPSEVIATRDGKQLYVSVRGVENAIKSIDPSTHAVTGTLRLATQPDTLMLTPDGKQLVVGMRGQPAQLVVVAVPGLTLQATIDVAEAGTTAGNNWLSGNGRYSFVTYEGGSAPGVAVVDHRTNTVIDRYAYPSGGTPHGIFYADPAATDGPQVAVAAAAVRVARDRVVAVRVTCSSGASATAAGARRCCTLRASPSI